MAFPHKLLWGVSGSRERIRFGRNLPLGRVLRIVYQAISAQLIQKAGFTRKSSQTGAVDQSEDTHEQLHQGLHGSILMGRAFPRKKVRFDKGG
jgi:hypothetical protein